MYLIEHDAKTLLEAYGVPAPPGQLISSIEELAGANFGAGPWVVKGQITAGGRGKAGIVRKAKSAEEMRAHAGRILGSTVKSHVVDSVRIEQNAGPALEAYVALILAPEDGKVKVLMSPHGGMDIEAMAHTPGAIVSDAASLDMESLLACIKRVADQIPSSMAGALHDAGKRMAAAFMGLEALLVEINPLFIRQDGSWIAGDAKVITDDSVIDRQDALRELALARPSVYIDAALKINHGFEYVVVDPEGEIGLITSGAGLSMMLIDELNARSLKPYNFLDIHAGSFHGKTTRLVQTLNWILEGKKVKLILVNIMAGGIDLGEFARVMLAAFDEIHLKLPFVVRFAGRNLDEGRKVLTARGVPMYTELDDAIEDVRQRMKILSGAP